MGNDLQSSLASLTGADHHARMQLPPSTLTARLSTSALQLIDRPFDHRSIGEERLDNPLDLASQLGKRLPKLTEFLSVLLILYAHISIA